MAPLIITIILFIILSIYLIVITIQNIISLILNLLILWVILIRAFFEVREKKLIYPYLISTLITTIIFLIWFDAIQVQVILWPILFIMFVFVIAELIILGLYLYKKYELDKKIFKKKKTKLKPFVF